MRLAPCDTNVSVIVVGGALYEAFRSVAIMLMHEAIGNKLAPTALGH